MFYLYILKNQQGRHYIGITATIKKRLATHNNGGVRSTKSYRPWLLVYHESFESKKDARLRELFLKKTVKARKELFGKIELAPSSSLA